MFHIFNSKLRSPAVDSRLTLSIPQKKSRNVMFFIINMYSYKITSVNPSYSTFLFTYMLLKLGQNVVIDTFF